MVFRESLNTLLIHKRLTVYPQPYIQRFWVPIRGLPSALFADAEAAENDTEQIVSREFAGDQAKCLLGQAEFFGE